MKLISFRVREFRSINDSGDIEVAQRTALVGRNESGKTNLLRALESLNPPGGAKPFDPVKDFPRHRDLREFRPTIPLLTTTWDLSESEQRELAKLTTLADEVKTVTIQRDYEGKRYVILPSFRLYAVDISQLTSDLAAVQSAVTVAVGNDSSKTAATQWAERTAKITAANSDANALLATIKEVAPSFTALLKDESLAISKEGAAALTRIAALPENSAKASESESTAKAWVESKLPSLIFLDEYPELRGHQDISSYLAKKQQNPAQLDDADKNFEKLVKVAGLSPEELQSSLGANHERRQYLANRAGAAVTAKLQEIWKDRKLKVRFNLDERHFDTLVSDPNNVYDIEINLDQRSRGLKWFFSFYITFAADTAGGSAQNAILLLDEPGLFLHAVAQADLLRHFATDFENQIIYTTHSPFMVPTKELSSIRTVNISQDNGTTVTNDPTGDSKTLFPLQQALGYNLTQTMFIGAKNLVVEGVTDYWYIQSVSDYLNDSGQLGLTSGIVITPAGGSQKVSYMVALLSSQELEVAVLLDSEQGTTATRDELVKTKLILENRVLFIADQFEVPLPTEADVEDMLDPAAFADLVKAVYAAELTGKTLALNKDTPRIVKRYEAAFAAQGLTFHKTRPARLFLREFGKDPAKYIAGESKQRFERLCAAVNKQMAAVGTRP